jgi:hypothetical protein
VATGSAKDKKSERRKQRERFKKKVTADCSRLLGENVAAMEYPGGKSRDSFRVVMENR